MAGNRHERGDHEFPPLEAPPEGSLRAGHEERDVNAWAVGKFGIALVLLCILSLSILVGLFQYLSRYVAKAPPAEVNDARRLPPAPRLQTTPVLDLKAMRDAEDQILTTYGWVDQSKGVVRIPIDKAIDLLAQKGLPSRTQSGMQTASQASVPLESGLGPVVQQEGGPLAGGAK